MKNVLTIPTEDPNISLVEVTTPQDDAALLLALREKPHTLTPDQEGAPDHREYAYMPLIRQANPGTKQFSIRNAGHTVGVIDLVPHETDPDRLDIDYKIGLNERRKGFASKALRAAAGFAHQEIGKGVVTLEIKPDNIASQGVARKAGFIKTGTQSELFTYTHAPRGSEPVAVSLPASQIADLETFESIRSSAYEEGDHSPEDLSALTEVTKLKDGRPLFNRAVLEILGPYDTTLEGLEAAKKRTRRVIGALASHEVVYDVVLGGAAEAPVTEIRRRITTLHDSESGNFGDIGDSG